MNDGCAGLGHQRAEDDAARPIGRDRALVFVERRQRVRSVSQAPAEFVAHLIACRERLGDFRRARRRSPGTGTGYYADIPHTGAGHRFETEA